MARITALALTRRPSSSDRASRSSGASEGGRSMHEQEARAERDRLLVGLLGEPAAADAHGEAEVVADQRARPGLSADAAFVHHEDAQPLRGAVDGRREARRPGAHDDHVEVVAASSAAGAPTSSAISALDGSLRTRPSGSTISGSFASGPALASSSRPFVRRRQAEGVRGGALLEDLPQLVGPARPRLAHDVHGLRNDAPIPRPLEQETRDRLVEDLVERPGRPRHVVVDASERHRVADRVGRRLIRPDVRPERAAPARRAGAADARARAGDAPMSTTATTRRARAPRPRRRLRAPAASATRRPDRRGTRSGSRGRTVGQAASRRRRERPDRRRRRARQAGACGRYPNAADAAWARCGGLATEGTILAESRRVATERKVMLGSLAEVLPRRPSALATGARSWSATGRSRSPSSTRCRAHSRRAS